MVWYIKGCLFDVGWDTDDFAKNLISIRLRGFINGNKQVGIYKKVAADYTAYSSHDALHMLEDLNTYVRDTVYGKSVKMVLKLKKL